MSLPVPVLTIGLLIASNVFMTFAYSVSRMDNAGCRS